VAFLRFVFWPPKKWNRGKDYCLFFFPPFGLTLPKGRNQASWGSGNSSVLTDYNAADNGLQAAPRQTEILPVLFLLLFSSMKNSNKS
jgi:hypothetical protein